MNKSWFFNKKIILFLVLAIAVMVLLACNLAVQKTGRPTDPGASPSDPCEDKPPLVPTCGGFSEGGEDHAAIIQRVCNPDTGKYEIKLVSDCGKKDTGCEQNWCDPNGESCPDCGADLPTCENKKKCEDVCCINDVCVTGCVSNAGYERVPCKGLSKEHCEDHERACTYCGS